MIDIGYNKPSFNPETDGHNDALILLAEEEADQFQLTDKYLDELKTRIEKFNGKAAKLGFPSVAIQTFGKKTIPHPTQEGMMLSVNVVKIDYPYEVKIDGWQFIAKVEPLFEGHNVIKHVPGCDTDIPEEYRTKGMFCDRCGVNRYRKATFILKKDDEWKQVGSTCLRDFLGHKAPAEIASYLEALQNVGRYVEGLRGDGFDMFADDSTYVYTIKTYLQHVIAVSEAHGYISKNKARDTMKQSTADAAFDNMCPPKGRDPSELIPVVCHSEKADEVLQWAKEHYAALAANGKGNDYEWTIAMLLEQEAVEYKHLGFIASIYGRYMREKTAQAQSGGYLWNINETVNFTGKVLMSQLIEGRYGNVYLTKFDVDGNIVVSFIGYCKLEEQQTYSFQRATVQKHSDFQGERQTQVKISFRCKANKAAV